MRIAKKLFLFLILIFFFSCEEHGLFVDFCDCTLEEPLKTNLEIKLDIDYWGPSTLIKVYVGNLEDGVLYNSYNAHTSPTIIPDSVSINKKYTVTATYFKPPDYYIAVDSATPKVRYVKCNVPCYFVYDRIIDLRLKYTK
jgi:hypothetical protein